MALTPETDESFIREVDEDLRRDRLTRLWRDYGRVALIAISLGLIVLAGYLYWRETQREKASQQAEQFITAVQALQGGDAEAATAKLEALAKDGNGGYRGLAQLLLAGSAVDAGEVDKAAQQMASLQTDAKAPQVLRDLAAARAVMLKFDTLPPKDAQAALKPLAQEGKPYFALAAELLALSYMNNGEPEKARPLLEAVAGLKTAPISARSRAGNLLQLLPAETPSPAKADSKGQTAQ